jgi:hypothetical protein
VNFVTSPFLRWSAETAIARLDDLAGKAEVQYKIEGLSMASTRPPICVAQYAALFTATGTGSVGIRFHISVPAMCDVGLQRRCHHYDRKSKQGQNVFHVGSGFGPEAAASVGMPTLADAFLLIAAIFTVAWFGCVFVLGDDLIKKEITTASIDRLPGTSLSSPQSGPPPQ